MKLRVILEQFSISDINNCIGDEIKIYINSINKYNFFSYVEKNINQLLDLESFVVTLIKNASKLYDVSQLLNKINFVNHLTTKNSKKQLLDFLEVKSISRKKTTMDFAEPIVPKRFYELLDYQYLIKEQVINYINDNIKKNRHLNRLLIHMPTGTGKTKTSMHTIINLYLKYDNFGSIIWLAHTDELLRQAYTAFLAVWQVLGNRKIKISFNNIDSVEKSNCIYFMSYQKIISLYKNAEDLFTDLRDNLTICVCDEAHKVLAPETFKAVESLMISFDSSHPKTLIGLTATPGRKYQESEVYGDNIALAEMFNKNIFSININDLDIFHSSKNNTIDKNSYIDVVEKDTEIISYFQNRGVLAKIERIPLTYENNNIEINKIFTKIRTNDYTQKELKKIGEYTERNNVIIEQLMLLNRANIPTIVFACTNEQGRLISDVLTLTGIKNNCVFGDTSDSLRKQYLNDFEDGKYNILINNAILTTGFDSPRIKCVFITRPTNSIVLYSQMLGRGLRGKMMGGNEKCYLVDVMDNLSKFQNENFAFNYFDAYWRR